MILFYEAVYKASRCSYSPISKIASLSKLAASSGVNRSEIRFVVWPKDDCVCGTANRSSCLANDVML